jgi:hypothetical protein
MFAVVATLAAASAGTVIWRHVRVASTNGARVNLLATVVPRGLAAGEADATVTFTRVDGQDLELDIYRPNNAAGTVSPIVFYVHGGGWILGDRRMQAANLRWPGPWLPGSERRACSPPQRGPPGTRRVHRLRAPSPGLRRTRRPTPQTPSGCLRSVNLPAGRWC